MDRVKKDLDLFLATAFAGVNSDKWHLMLLVPHSWHVVWKIGSSLAAVLGRVLFEPVAAASDEGCEWTYSVTPPPG